jgi:hypothetical protein
MLTMKKQLHFKFERPKTRVHRILFENDTPFKPKKVDLKTGYRRKDKHPAKMHSLND